MVNKKPASAGFLFSGAVYCMPAAETMGWLSDATP